jgi:hypothetical protein
MIQYLDHKSWKNKMSGEITAVIMKMTLYQLKLHL